MADKPNILGKITKFVFIGGAILFFIFMAYLIVIFVPRAISGIVNMGSSVTDSLKADQKIVLKTVKEINSGKPFLLSWEYEPANPGEYYLSYTCDESLSISIQSSNGEKIITCDSPFRLGEGIKNISLIPTVSKKNTLVDSNITISYKDSETENQVAYGDTLITLKNIDTSTDSSNPYNANLSGSTVVAKPVSNTPTTTKTPTKTTSTKTNYGSADLQISNIKELGESTLSFTVYNVGTKTSGSWYFSYTDAENPSRVIQSPLQMSLAPGQGMLTTVSFDSQSNNSQLINIVVDPYNLITESNESNNKSYVVIHGDENGSSNSDNNYNEDDAADLLIDEIEVGRMSGSRFIEDDQIDEDDTAAVRFIVRNNGGESTGTWRYEITNTPNDDDYESENQSSLRPGDERTITVEFDGLDFGTYNLRLEADSDDDVDEEKENNNTKTKRLEVIN